MPTDNMSQELGDVKSPPQGAFAPNGRMRRSRKLKPATLPEQPDTPSTSASVANLEQAREAKNEELEKAWLLMHRTDARTGELKPPSLDHIFSRHMVSGKTGQWACQASDATGAIVHRWTDNYWKAINNEIGTMVVAGDWLDRHAPQAAGARKAEQCWEYAVGRLRRFKPLPALDIKRAIVPCADAYIEILRAGFQVLAPDPALGMTHAINIASGGKADRPYFPQVLPEDSEFAKFLARAQPNPAVRALLQEQCGMTLLPGNYSQAAWWYGVAGSGKSTLAELVEAMHRQSVRLNLETLGDRFSLEPLVGASLILVDEVECEKWAEGRFKTLVSGNGIGIDRKHEKVLASYHSRAKWLITSNNAPFIRDKSDGVWRRLVVVSWDVEIPQEERKSDFHKTLLEKEGKLILDWMLEGARRIVTRGRTMAEHELPEEARKAKQQARSNCDSVRAWSEEMRVVREEGHWMSLAEVYKQYETWCTTQGYLINEILTPRQFWRGMATAGKVRPERKSNRRVNGVQADFYELRILGRAVDQVRNWAVDEQVSSATEELATTDEIYCAYDRWARSRVDRAVMTAAEILPRHEFWTAMDQACVIDRRKCQRFIQEGKAVEGYRLKVITTKKLADAARTSQVSTQGDGLPVAKAYH